MGYLQLCCVQTSNLNARRKNPTFLTSTLSDSLFLDLTLRERCCWKGTRQNHGRNHRLLKCRRTMPNTSTRRSWHELHFRYAEVDSLTIVATSDNYPDFAFVALTKDELVSGLEARKWSSRFCSSDCSLESIRWNIRNKQELHDWNRYTSTRIDIPSRYHSSGGPDT